MKICCQVLMSSTQLHHSSFHVEKEPERQRNVQKMKNARAKRAKLLFFFVKYANLGFFLSLSSSCLLMLPVVSNRKSH